MSTFSISRAEHSPALSVLIMPLCTSDYQRLVKTYSPSWWIKKSLFVKWGHVNTLLWMMSASQLSCQHQCRVDTHTHTYKNMHWCTCASWLCHSTGMPSRDKGEQTALNELEWHGTCLFLSRNTAWATMAEWTLFRVLTEELLQQHWAWKPVSPDRVHVLCL